MFGLTLDIEESSAVPIGKEMAEALLLECDESTASLSEVSTDREQFDETEISDAKSSCTPAAVDNSRRTLSVDVKMPRNVPPPPGFYGSETRGSSPVNAKLLATLSPYTFPLANRYVALDCESK